MDSNEYNWKNKHGLYGFPADTFPEFLWIGSLETRFKWLKLNHRGEKTASIYLLREMIQWGGSQNGVLQKFDDGVEQVNLFEILKETIDHLDQPERAIESGLKFPGMGLTYASKLLRFLDPDNYGSLDRRLRNALESKAPDVPIIHDGYTNSMVRGYRAFLDYIKNIRHQLVAAEVDRPPCSLQVGSHRGWRTADIEMALFTWASALPKGKPIRKPSRT